MSATGRPFFRGLTGHSAAMQALFSRIEHVAPFDVPVLIRGECGTEKELVAEAIHALSRRRSGKFDAVHCGMFRGTLPLTIDWEAAIIVACDGGTLFLDSVTELPLRAQALLVELVDRGEMWPALSTTPVSADVRLIAATGTDLESAVRSGVFQETLYDCLASHVTLDVPPLRARRDDIRSLVEHFQEAYTRKHGLPMCGVTAEALAMLEAYAWPGNLAELESVLAQPIISHSGDWITAADLAPRLRGSRTPVVVSRPFLDRLRSPANHRPCSRTPRSCSRRPPAR